MQTVIYDGKSTYSRYRVIDRIYNDRPARLLVAGHSEPQSGIALDDEAELLFDYIQRLFEVALSTQPRSVLIIGGGAFTLPTAIAQRLAGTQVDAVEIDPLLPSLAQKYFNLHPNPNLTIITQDGRQYLESCQKQYDLIIVDAFSGYVVPRSLITIEATTEYARLLTPSGVLAMNIISRYQGPVPTLAHELIASLETSFPNTQLYPADPTDHQLSEQNLIVVASRETEPDLDYLQSVPVQLQALDSSLLQLHDE